MEFLDKFNEITKEKYLPVRISSVDVQKKPPVVQVNFLVPYDILDSYTEDDKKEILSAVTSLLPDSMQVVVTYTKSFIDEDIVKRYVLSFFKEKHPTVLIESSEIDIKIVNQIAFITIHMKSMFYDFFKSVDLTGNITQYMAHKMCNEVRVDILDSKKDIDFDTDLATEESITIISRRLRTSNHEKVVGKDITARARYIIDSKEQEEIAVYAGEVVDFKRNESKKTGNSYYVFKIDDTTGSMTCKAFAKYQGEGVYDQIGIGDTIIVQGRKDLDTFLHDSVLLCRDISKCEIDKSSIILKEELKPVPLSYVAVKPEKYTDFVQDDLFGTGNNEAVTPYLLGKSFVVFDFETTGTDVTDEVTELGAVKIVDGIITETLSTFVNPHIHIPEEITKLTSITDDDVKDAPDMSDVIADFYKFSENCVLVAHNTPFDKKFVDKYAKLNGFVFPNRTMDTLAMARKSVICKNYKLGTLCAHFGISLEGAHRAVNDCLATAKLFIELVKIGKF